MEERFEQFIRERQYIANVSPTTVEWYRRCLKRLPSPNPTQSELLDIIIQLREKGLKETGVNTVLRGINSYLHWNSGSDKKCGAGCTHPRAPRIREPQEVLPTFTEAQFKRLIAWKPKDDYARRLHLLILFLLDTGCRISEALTLRIADINLDDLLVTLDGKGRKQRLIPFSFELRRVLFRYVSERERKPDMLLFACSGETMLNRRNVLRSVKRLCRSLGFSPPRRTLHAFRHTFAVNYLRRGGSVFHLQKILGHSTLEMTRRYANLNTIDLQAMCEKLSPLRP